MGVILAYGLLSLDWQNTPPIPLRGPRGPRPFFCAPFFALTVPSGTFRLRGKGSDMQPKAIESYVVGNPLANASFGDVLRGIPLEGEATLCLLQILPETVSRNPEAKSLLQRTTKQWMSLKDLHAVGLLGSGEADGRLYLVYEYLQGRLLSDILDRCQQEGLPLSGDQAVYLCERLAGALLSVSSSGTAFG